MSETEVEIYDFYSGKKYILIREASREVEITAVVDWTERSLKRRSRVRHWLFSIGKRQAAKYGKQTAPKLYLNHSYTIRRPDQTTRRMKLYREAPGEPGKRYLWMKKVSK